MSKTSFRVLGVVVAGGVLALAVSAFGAVTPIPNDLYNERCSAGGVGLQGDTAHDRMVGTAKRDLLRGGDGHDVLRAGADADCQFGGPGRDTLKGGPGDDLLNGGPGKDRLHCDRGNKDIAQADALDRVKGCETIK